MSYVPYGQNFLVNGNFDFWQRGSSFTSTGYHADMMNSLVSGTATVTRSTTVPSGSRYSWLVTTGAASSYGQLHQAIEQIQVLMLQGQTVTLSALVLAGGTWTGNMQLEAFYSTSTDAYASQTTSIGAGTVVAPNVGGSVWKQLTYTFVIPSTANGLKVGVIPTVVQPSGSTMYIAQMKLELGSIATPFQPELPALALMRCQRFYEKSYDIDVAPGTNTEIGSIRSIAQFTTGLYQLDLRYKVTKKTATTATIYSQVGVVNTFYCQNTSTSVACTVGNFGRNGGLVYAGGGTLVVGDTYEYHFVADCSL